MVVEVGRGIRSVRRTSSPEAPALSARSPSRSRQLPDGNSQQHLTCRLMKIPLPLSTKRLAIDPRPGDATSFDTVSPAPRMATVDAWRFIAMLAVIAIHTLPQQVSDPAIAAHWLDASFLFTQVARFAVPYFFIVSGYFWGSRAARSTDVLRDSWPAMRRMVGLFVVWSLVYALPHDPWSIRDGGAWQPFRVAWWHLRHQLESPSTLLTQGTTSPLWFLVGLLSAMAISAWFVQRRWYRALGVIAILLYVVQLLSRPYRDTIVGLPIDFNTRNGPFVATLFFVTGLWLSRRAPRASWAATGVGLFVIGLAMHLAENWFVTMNLGVRASQDFVIGTYPMGAGIALVALSGRPIAYTNQLARLGAYTLGIYVVHALFVEVFEPLTAWSPPIVAHVATLALVATCSYLTVRLLSKGRYSRMLVR